MSELEKQLQKVDCLIPDGPETVPAGEAGALRLPRQISAFRHRNYRLFFGGQIISLSGTWMQQVAHGWLVLDLTNSARMLGIVGFISALPILFISLPAGLAADRFSKRNLIMATQSCAMLLAFALGMLTHWQVVTVYHVMAIGFLLGAVNALDAPARQSFMIEIVGRDDLTNAIALNSATFNGARIIGPTLAALVIPVVGLAGAFFLNGLSFLGVILGLALMQVSPMTPASRASVSDGLREGLHFIRGHRTVSALLILTGVASIFGVSYTVLMPIFARDILKVGLRGLGFLMASAGAGALIGAFVLSSLGSFKAKGRLLLVGNLTFCSMLVLFSFSKHPALSMGFLLVAGWGVMTNMALTNTLIQVSAPDHLRGRVMSAYTLMFLGMAPFGSLQAGVIAHWFGAPAAVRIGAGVCAVAAIALSPWIVRAGLLPHTKNSEA